MSSFHNTIGRPVVDIGKSQKSGPWYRDSPSAFHHVVLFAHEMGHYLTCLYYRIDTLPYFIPALQWEPWARLKIRFHSNIGRLYLMLSRGPIAGFV
jgi:hypothetical protein